MVARDGESSGGGGDGRPRLRLPLVVVVVAYLEVLVRRLSFCCRFPRHCPAQARSGGVGVGWMVL
jgi:hypothetical protein